MKKSEVIDLIKHQISGGDLTSDLLSRYGEQFIEKYVELAYTSIIYALQVAATKAGDYGQLDPYIKTFKNVPVICDEDRDEYYSELPCAVIPLPMARGIRMISPMRGQGVDFIYRENN